MSSSLKHASFYLQSALNHLKEKTVQYGGIENYFKSLKSEDTEIVPYLEKVAMNAHRFQLAKENMSDMFDGKIGFNHNIVIGAGVFFFIVFGLIMLRAAVDDKFRNTGGFTIPQRLRTAIIYITTVLTFVFLAIWIFRSLEEKKTDLSAFKDIRMEGEEFFKRFNNNTAIAIYYVLRNRNAEPKFSKSRKDITEIYKKFVGLKITIGKVRGLSEWNDIINEAKPDYLLLYEHLGGVRDPKNVLSKEAIDEMGPVKENKVAFELAQLEKADYKLKMWDKINMLGEIRSKTKELFSVILRKDDIDNPLTDNEAREIVAKEIVPHLVVKEVLTRVEGYMYDIPTAPKGDASIVETEKGCVQECVGDEGCRMAAYNIPSRTCTLYKDVITHGSAFKPDKKSVLYMKGEHKPTVFIKGGELWEAPKDNKFEVVPPAKQDCRKVCLETMGCIRADSKNNTDEKCSITMAAKDNIEPDKITDGGEFFYKIDLSKISSVRDKSDMFDYLTEEMARKIEDVCKKYNYEINVFTYFDDIKTQLEKEYDYDTFGLVISKVEELLNKIDEVSRQKRVRKKPENDKFVSEEVFISGMDKWSYGDFLYLKDDVVVKLFEATNTLKQKVEKGITEKNSQDNIFVVKDRLLEKLHAGVVIASILLVLGFIYYLSYKFENSPKFIAFTEKADTFAAKQIKTKQEFFDVFGNAFADALITFLVPLSFVLFAIILMVSSLEKERKLFEYNKDILENNAATLVTNLFDMKYNFDIIDKELPSKKTLSTSIKDLEISYDKKKNLYGSMKKALEMYDKCNLVTDGSDVKYPFPYVDITINIIICLVSVLIIMYTFAKLDPINKFAEIKDLNKLSAKINMRQPVDLSFLKCEDDVELVVSLKILGAVFFFCLIMMFAGKLRSSSTEYEKGLYNSRYYKESRCAK